MAAPAAAGGAGGNSGSAAASVLPGYLVFKTREATTTTNASGRPQRVVFKGFKDKYETPGLSKEAIIRILKSRLVKYDSSSGTESGDAEDRISIAPEGTVYTWIIKGTPGSGPYTLIAGRTRGAQEIGTLHESLNSLSDIDGPVIAAGELKKTRDGVEYNFFSGSYMEKIFIKKPDPSAQHNAKVAAATVFNMMFPGKGNEVGTPLLDPSSVITKTSNFTNYENWFNKTGGSRGRKSYRSRKDRKRRRTSKKLRR